jgi:uncharacterized protein YeaO (DUF488 family)
MIPKTELAIKRIYLPAAADDGIRVLVDRLWPRGVKKTEARIDHWMKDIAPSPQLRKWFGHDPARYAEFHRRYFAELRENAEIVQALRDIGQGHKVTLLYGAHDEAHNQARVLADFMKQHP